MAASIEVTLRLKDLATRQLVRFARNAEKALGGINKNFQGAQQGATRLTTAVDGLGASLGRVGATASGVRDVTRSINQVGRANRGVRQVNRSFSNLNATLGVTRSLVRSVVTAFLGIQGVRFATNTLVSFSEAIKTVEAVSGATGTTLERLTDTARELGATTRFTGTQAAEGLVLLARAGFTAEEAIAAVPATLDLAVAGALSLQEAAKLTSNAIRQFALDASEAARVADVLVKAANTTNTSVSQLGLAFTYAGPAAAAAGQSLEETAAALGVLGNAGIQASLAGTNLRGIFASLLQPTARATRTIQRLGLSVQDLNPSVRDVSDIFAQFAEVGLTAGEAVAIFGRRQANAALFLTQYSRALDDQVSALENAEGTARRTANTIDESLRGAFLRARSAVEEFILATGDDGLNAALRDSLNLFADAVRILAGFSRSSFQAAKGAKELAEALRILGVVIGSIIAGRALSWLAGLSVRIFQAAAAARAATGVFKAMGAALAVLRLNPIVAGVTLLGTAFFGLRSLLSGATDEMEIQADFARKNAQAYDAYAESVGRLGRQFGETSAQFDLNRWEEQAKLIENLGDRLENLLGQEMRLSQLPEILAGTDLGGAMQSILDDMTRRVTAGVNVIGREFRGLGLTRTALDANRFRADIQILIEGFKELSLTEQQAAEEADKLYRAIARSQDTAPLIDTLIRRFFTVAEVTQLTIDQVREAQEQVLSYRGALDGLVRSQLRVARANIEQAATFQGIIDRVEMDIQLVGKSALERQRLSAINKLLATSTADMTNAQVLETLAMIEQIEAVFALLGAEQDREQQKREQIRQSEAFIRQLERESAAIDRNLERGQQRRARASGGGRRAVDTAARQLSADLNVDFDILPRGVQEQVQQIAQDLVRNFTAGLLLTVEDFGSATVPLTGAIQAYAASASLAAEATRDALDPARIYTDVLRAQQELFENPQQRAARRGLQEAQRQQNNVLENSEELWRTVSGVLENEISAALTDLIFNAQDAEEAILNLSKAIGEQLVGRLIKDLINAAPSFISGGGGNNDGDALGRAYDNGRALRYQRGGIFNSPTYFPTNEGRTGLLGEAGPEAILPLTRDRSGRLGVTAEVGGGGGASVFAPNFTTHVTVEGNGDPEEIRRVVQEENARTVAAMRSIARNEMATAFGNGRYRSEVARASRSRL